ncbi:hypothetical protein CAL26_09780 [Bordetella genomosp. 9]|uniref:Uncharacterized protein n=2 Tax=Bordetella genomosp. 9 TaxID=1416803 RepID=A0A261RFK4_9BORD|nr:hypothetical protein CAL26_09780 [Bordetella genomosp. 9]
MWPHQYRYPKIEIPPSDDTPYRDAPSPQVADGLHAKLEAGEQLTATEVEQLREELLKRIRIASADTLKKVALARLSLPEANPPPTFDEWFKAKNHGASFEVLHMQAGTMWETMFRALAREMRDYTTEMVQRSLEKNNG